MSHVDSQIYEIFQEVLTDELGITHAQKISQTVRTEYYERHRKAINFTSLSSAISNCRTCPEAKSAPEAGWWNWQDCDLLIVHSNSYHNQKYANSIGQHLSDSGFSSAFCGAIGLTKCSFEDITFQNIQNCTGWLFDQIQLSQPKAIAIIGSAAYDIFKTSELNYTNSINSSWWYGLYKVYALPSFSDLEDSRWKQSFDEIHNFIYGNDSDVVKVGHG